jgi:hypothetical protein
MNANSNIAIVSSIFDAILANLGEHLDKRVEAKVEALQVRMEELNERLKLVEALEEQLTSAITLLDNAFNAKQPATTATLDQTEEFRAAVIKIINTHTMGDEFLNPLVTAPIDNGEFVDAINKAAREVARSEAEEAVSDHCSDYEHDDIHETGDHEVDEHAVKDIIKEVLNNVTVTLKI